MKEICVEREYKFQKERVHTHKVENSVQLLNTGQKMRCNGCQKEMEKVGFEYGSIYRHKKYVFCSYFCFISWKMKEQKLMKD